MKFIKFILQKIIIVEIMLLVLYFAKSYFGVNIDIVNYIVDNGLDILTPIAIFSIIPYIILCILSNSIVEIILGVVIGGVILHYMGIIQ